MLLKIVYEFFFYGAHIFVLRPLTSHKLPPLGSICYLLVQSWMSSRHSIEHIFKKDTQMPDDVFFLVLVINSVSYRGQNLSAAAW